MITKDILREAVGAGVSTLRHFQRNFTDQTPELSFVVVVRGRKSDLLIQFGAPSGTAVDEARSRAGFLLPHAGQLELGCLDPLVHVRGLACRYGLYVACAGLDDPLLEGLLATSILEYCAAADLAIKHRQDSVS